MGAEFDYFTIERAKQLALTRDNTPVYTSGLTEAYVTQYYKDQCEDAAYEDGNSYSGRINMSTGIEFHRDKYFNSLDAALDYINENAQKWENAIAVKFVNGDTMGYVVGACCSS